MSTEPNALRDIATEMISQMFDLPVDSFLEDAKEQAGFVLAGNLSFEDVMALMIRDFLEDYNALDPSQMTVELAVSFICQKFISLTFLAAELDERRGPKPEPAAEEPWHQTTDIFEQIEMLGEQP